MRLRPRTTPVVARQGGNEDRRCQLAEGRPVRGQGSPAAAPRQDSATQDWQSPAPPGSAPGSGLAALPTANNKASELY